jgi:hypothetical protein
MKEIVHESSKFSIISTNSLWQNYYVEFYISNEIENVENSIMHIEHSLFHVFQLITILSSTTNIIQS